MKRLLLPCLFVIASTTACKGEAPVGGVTGNVTAGGGTNAAGSGSGAGATATGSTTGDPAGGSGGDGAATPVGGGATTGSGATSGGTTTTAGAPTTGIAGTTAAGGAPGLPITDLSELDGGVEGVPDAEIYALYVEALEYANAVACVCGGGSGPECSAEIGAKSFLEEECESEALLADANGRAFIECALVAEQDFVRCVVPEDGSDICSSDCPMNYVDAISGCPELTDDTYVRLDDQCYGVPPFECEDGEKAIPNFRVCDLTSDCEDQSDELRVNCPN